MLSGLSGSCGKSGRRSKIIRSMVKKKGFKLSIFVVCIVLVFIAGFIGSAFTGNTVNSEWYELNKPSFTPPGFIFSPVWITLYFLIGV